MKRSLVIAIAATLGLAAVLAGAQTRSTASGSETDTAIRAAIAKNIPGAAIDGIAPSVIPGYREVAIGGKVVYVSTDGKYLLQGALIKLDGRENLTAASEAVLRRGVLAAVGEERRIIFAPANPKYRVTVFTDIDCGYCRKMHSQIAEYNKAGIAVEYLFFPREGVGSAAYTKAVNVWCAPDRRQALTDAKSNKPLPDKTCPNSIATDYELGQRVGVDGTPAVFMTDGTQIGGYLTPKDMLARLARQTGKVAAK